MPKRPRGRNKTVFLLDEFLLLVVHMTSSSSNQPTSTNRLTNSYFFYGTHPLRVPDHITTSSSAHEISTVANQENHHLSLNLTNSQNGFLSTSELSTTRSLNDLPECNNDRDDPREVLIYTKILN